MNVDMNCVCAEAVMKFGVFLRDRADWMALILNMVGLFLSWLKLLLSSAANNRIESEMGLIESY